MVYPGVYPGGYSREAYIPQGVPTMVGRGSMYPGVPTMVGRGGIYPGIPYHGGWGDIYPGITHRRRAMRRKEVSQDR